MNKEIVINATNQLCRILENNFNTTCQESVKLGMGRFYEVVTGRKYLKILMRDIHDNKVVTLSGSVHAFVDKENGDLYMAASWAAPAKGVRYNLITDMQKLEQVANWNGGYLYIR
jgi:hypothetical protein